MYSVKVIVNSEYLSNIATPYYTRARCPAMRTGECIKENGAGMRDVESGKATGSGKDHQALLRERVACPTCRVPMSLRNLRYRHVCRTQKTPAEIERMRSKASAAAIDAHMKRMAKKQDQTKDAIK